MQWFRPSTSEITFLHCSPELELYREKLQKSSKARCGAPNNCIYARFPDPQLQILHFWPPLIEQAPSWNLLKCGEIWWNQLQLLSPRHLIPANLHWFGPSTNDFTFFFAPHPQQHPEKNFKNLQKLGVGRPITAYTQGFQTLNYRFYIFDPLYLNKLQVGICWNVVKYGEINCNC